MHGMPVSCKPSWSVQVTPPILQFGTSRFLQAHVDLFVSEAMERREAIGGITVAQTTTNSQSSERVQALNHGTPYPVRIRGLQDGVTIDDRRLCGAVQSAGQAQTDWPRLRAAAFAAQVVVSDTGDQGDVLDPRDHDEQFKRCLLNLGHPVLAEHWLKDRRSADETVREVMNDLSMVTELEAVWADEVLPVFDAQGRGDTAREYLVALRERLRNPFLAHRLADTAQNHAQKKQRRFAPVVALAEWLGLTIAQTRLRAGLASST